MSTDVAELTASVPLAVATGASRGFGAGRGRGGTFVAKDDAAVAPALSGMAAVESRLTGAAIGRASGSSGSLSIGALADAVKPCGGCTAFPAPLNRVKPKTISPKKT